MLQTHNRKRFSISEVAADLSELVVLKHTVQPSTARVKGLMDPRLQPADTPPPQSATLGLHPVAHTM